MYCESLNDHISYIKRVQQGIPQYSLNWINSIWPLYRWNGLLPWVMPQSSQIDHLAFKTLFLQSRLCDVTLKNCFFQSLTCIPQKKFHPENINPKKTKHTSKKTRTYVRIVVSTMDTRMFIFGVRIKFWLNTFPHFTTKASIKFCVNHPFKI